MEASNPCINEIGKVNRSPEGDRYRRAGNELGAKHEAWLRLHEATGTPTKRAQLAIRSGA